MPSIRVVPALTFMLLAVGGCPSPSESGDEVDSTEDSTDSATDTGDDGLCEERNPGEFLDYSLVMNGAPIGQGDMDIDRECSVYDDEDDPKLTLDCGDFGFEVTLAGDPGATIPDILGEPVQLRFVQVEAFNYTE